VRAHSIAKPLTLALPPGVRLTSDF